MSMDALTAFQSMIPVLQNVHKRAHKFITISKAIHGGVRSKLKGVDLQFLKDKLAGKTLLDMFNDTQLQPLFHLLLLLLALRNATLNLTHRHIFAQIFSGHRDMREMYELMRELNHHAAHILPREKEVFTELLLKRICGYSQPLMFSQCSDYFHQSLDELKVPKEERPAQALVKVRYDMNDIKDVGMDMLYLNNPVKLQMLSNVFVKVEEDYLPEQFYPTEFRPMAELRDKMWMAQSEAAFALKEYKQISFFQTVGLFAIGYSRAPSSELKMVVHEISQIEKEGEKKDKRLSYLKRMSKLKREAIHIELERSQITPQERPQRSLEFYTWSIMLWVFETKNACLRQGGCSLRTEIRGRGIINYDPYEVSQLPYFFGEHSVCCVKQLTFFNEMDDSIHGMHLCIDTIKFPNQRSELALINYSCNGWSLRVQLLPNRKWRLSHKLVFEIDPSEEDDFDEAFQPFCYEMHILSSSEEVRKGKIRSWRDLDDLHIQIREFEGEEEVDLLKPGEVYDSIQIIIWDPAEQKDLTQAYLTSSRPTIGAAGLELCLVNYEAEKENVWVWARDVVPLAAEQQKLLKKYPIEYFATYFKFDPLYSKKDLEWAPTRALTGSDVISFGIQRFRLLLEGLYDPSAPRGKVAAKGGSFLSSEWSQMSTGDFAGEKFTLPKEYIRSF